MKFAIIILMAMAMGCAASRVSLKNDPVRVVKATSQRWYGGMEQSGWGTNYRFKVVHDKTAGITFDTIWIENRAYIPQLSPYEIQHRADFGAIDTLTLYCEYHHSNYPSDEYREHPPLSVGPEYDGAALLIYRKDGTRLSYAIKEITSLPAVYYP